MTITWLGHSAYLIETGGVSIVTDPYDESVGYGPITMPVDIATVSHDHFDHNHTGVLKGDPQVIQGPGTASAKGIRFKGIATYHDGEQGRQRGKNTVFVIESEGLFVCHAGDLGHELSDEQIREIGHVDVLLIPVGGTYTVDAQQATRVLEKIDPAVVIPMHFKTKKLDFPITGVDDFLSGKQNIRKTGSASVEVRVESLPKQREVVVLDHAL